MTLNDYLLAQGLSDEDFGLRIGRSRTAVNRYRRGLRMPDRETMLAIHRETAGAVTVESFYGLGSGCGAPGSAA